jgi:hypothetical protein
VGEVVAVTLHTCGADHQDNVVARALCEFEGAIAAELVAHADRYGIDAVAARDLWAHLRDINDDGANAYRLARKVMALGWRPTNGLACNPKDPT